MDRRSWLEGRRAAVTADYDAEAATYDENPYPNEMQRAFIDRLLETCPAGGIVLDAPCGTGQYFARVVASGRRVVGIDQSAGMLEQARARGIAEALHQVGLQELAFEHEFDGVMTVDAMENVFPEDWPLVLSNLRRAVRPGGHLYLTVEEIDEAADRRRLRRTDRTRPAGRAWRGRGGRHGRLPLLPGASPGAGMAGRRGPHGRGRGHRRPRRLGLLAPAPAGAVATLLGLLTRRGPAWPSG